MELRNGLTLSQIGGIFASQSAQPAQVGGIVGLPVVPLRFPQRFGKALDHGVLCLMGIFRRREPLEDAAHAVWPVDGDLFTDRNVQAHVQVGVGVSGFRRILGFQRGLAALDYGLVFGVLRNALGDALLTGQEVFATPGLRPGFAVGAADFFAGGGQSGHGGFHGIGGRMLTLARLFVPAHYNAGLDQIRETLVPRVLAGAVLISFAAVFVALSGVASAPAAFYRLIIGSAVLMGLAVLRRERLRLEPRFVAYVLLAGLSFTADLITWHLSIYRVGPGIATLLPNFQVVLMTLAGWLIWRERLTPRIAVAIGLAVVGLVVLLVAAPQAGHVRFMAGGGYGLRARVAHNAYLLFPRPAGGGASREAHPFFLCFLTLVASGRGLCRVLMRGDSLAVPFGMAWFWLACYGIGCQALGWFLISTGLPRVPAALGGLLLLLQPTLTFAWDHLIFGRRFTLLELAGAALALVGPYLGLRWRRVRRVGAS